MIKYMLVRTNMIWKNIKYQIGRTYKKTKNNENFDLKKVIARNGYDDHLDILAKEKNPKINKIINRLR